MRKLLFFVFATMFVFVFVNVTSCGPSAEEIARMDSIRIADSLRRMDSIRIVDSLRAVREAEAQKEANRKKVDEVAASTKAEYKLKMYEVNKVVYANMGGMNQRKSVTIYDVVTDEKTIIPLKDSESTYAVSGLKKGNDSKQVVVECTMDLHAMFTMDFYVDVEAKRVVRVRQD